MLGTTIPTLDDIEALRRDELSKRRLPDGRTWLDVAAENANKVGADLGETVVGSHRELPTLARRKAWVELRSWGLSNPKIGAGWGYDHTTIGLGVRIANGGTRRVAARREAV